MATTRPKLPDTVHAVLKAALAAARPEDRTPGPWHLGGAVRPVFPVRGQLSLAMRLAEHVANPGPETQRVSAILSAVKQYLDGKTDGKALRGLAEVRSSGAEAVARNAAGAAATLARGKPDLVHTGVQAAAAKAVVLVGPGAAATRLLEAIDDEILRCEAAAALEGAVSSRVERALWRGAEGGKTVHFVVTLANGNVASCIKLVRGKRAAVTEGSFDEALAVVPEQHFAAAVACAMRERARPARLALR